MASFGDGSTANRNTWGQVGGIANARYVAAGDYHTAVLKADGTVWTFGDNAEGQIGDGTTADRPTPVQVPAGGIKMIAVQGSFNMALRANSTVYA